MLRQTVVGLILIAIWFCGIGPVLTGERAAVGEESEQICRFCDEHTRASLPFGWKLEGEGRRYAPDRIADVLHIKIDVTPDFKKRTVAGTTTLTFSPISKPLSLLRLDAYELSIAAVRSEESIDDFVSSKHDLQIVFDPAIPVGKQVSVEVDYSAQPTQGLYFRTPEMGYPETDTQIWTQGETHEARFWFPCFDFPNERSSTEVICRVPQEMTVLSNGRKLSEKTDDSTGLKAVHWLQEKPHANYLICLVAGHLKKLEKKHGDLSLGFYTQPSLIEHAANSFEDTEKIMAFYEDEIGVPFPWHRYDQVTIRDFIAGGMENTSLTTLTHGTIFSKATENIRTSHRLDAHELAHQWFGDYVTCKDWSHLWLNEGFATFYTHLYEGHKYGRNAMLYGLYQDADGRILKERSSPKPVVYNQYKDAMEQFDYRSYPKGSWVLHMLRCQLGADLYRESIRTYLTEHALSSVISDDLRAVIERKSGRTFDRFFDQWLYHAGYPKLKIDYRWLPEEKLAKLTVEQTQAVNDNVMLFHLPTKLRFVVDGEIVDHRIEIRDKKHEFYFPLPKKPTVVRFDPEFSLLAKVEFNKSDDQLFAQLDQPDDMIGRLLAAVALGDRKTNKSIENLSRILNEDPFFGVRIAASKSLRKIHNDDAFQALAASTKQVDARVRIRVVEDLTSFYRDEAFDAIQEIVKNETNPAILAKAIEAMGRYPVDETFDAIVGFLEVDSFRNEIANAAIKAIGQQKSPRYVEPLKKAIEARIDQYDSRSIGPALSTLATISSSSDDKTGTQRFLTKYLNSPKESVQVAAINSLGNLKDKAAIAILQAFVVPDTQNRVSKAAESAIQKAQTESPLAPRELAELRSLTLELKQANETMRQELDDLKAKLEARPSSKPKDGDATKETDGD